MMRARSQLFVEALGIRAALPVLLWTLPLDRVLDALTPRSASLAPTPSTLAAIEQTTDTLTRGSRLIRTACLMRALLRYALLRRKGFGASFVIGVRPGGADGFEAHAWVTLDDAPLMETQAIDYRPTFVWPRAA